MVRPSSRFTRRAFLGITVPGLAGTALLAACGPNRPGAAPAAPPAAEKADAKPTAAPAAKTETKPAAPAAQPAATTAAAAPAKPAAAQKTVVRYHGPANNQSDIVGLRAEEFAKENPNIEIKLELFPSLEYLPKIQSLIAGNQLGDVFWAVSSQATYHQWSSKGVLAPIDDYIKRDNIKPTDYFENAWKGQLIDGKMYGLTFKAHPGASLLYFNKDLFAKGGVAEPTDDWTIDQFVEAAQKLTSGDTYGYLIPLNHDQHLTFAANLFGKQMISEDGTKAQFNSPEVQEAIMWDYDHVFTRKTSPVRDQVPQPPQNPGDFFVGGKAAMFKSGTWDLSLGKRIKDSFKWSVVLFPRGVKGNRGAMFSQDYTVINAKSTAKDQSWEVCKAFCDKRTGILLGLGGTPNNGNSGTAGGRPDVYESEELRNNPDYTPDVHEARNRSLKETTPFNYPKNYRMAEIVTTYKSAMDQVWSGQKPDKAWADDVNGAMQAIVDKPL